MKQIYLDANGSSIPLNAVKNKVLESLESIGNPSSFHFHGRKSRQLLDEARNQVALSLRVSVKSVIFTSGASESNRLFLDAVVKRTESSQKHIAILASIFEHPSLIKPLLALKHHPLISVEFIKANKNGQLAYEEINFQNYDVVVCTSAHNETGIMPDLNHVAKNIRSDAIFMSDISQSLARDENIPTRADVLVCSAQKIGGLAGCGAIILHNNASSLEPPYLGGGQEKGFRPGTEALCLITGFGEACAHIRQTQEAYKQIELLRNYFEEKIQEKIPCTIVGKDLKRLCNTSAITFMHENPESLRIKMDLAGLSVGFGSACSGLAPEGSFSLSNMDFCLEEQKKTVRFSFDHTITKDDINEALIRLQNIIAQ